MRQWDNLVEQYVKEYSARGVCDASIDSVRRDMTKWGNWLKHRRPRLAIECIDSDMIIKFIAARTAFKSKVTTYGIISRMRGMGDFLCRNGYWKSNPLRWIKGPKIELRSHLPKRIKNPSMQKLWQAASVISNPYKRSLCICILSILYGTALRRGELVRLNLESWQSAEGTLILDGRKTGRERKVVVPELTGHCLDSYLLARHNHLERLGIYDQDALLVNTRGARISDNSVSGIVSRIIQRAGIEEGITLHQFRHTCASDLLESGASLAEVKRILGHRHISTTVRYLHITDPQKTEAVKHHPINTILGGQLWVKQNDLIPS
jgi:site-specific recombinase XerD